MSFVTAALIGGGVALAGGLMSADAARSAGNTQADAARNATQAQLQIFNTQNQQQAPYRQAGYSALSALLSGLGLGGGGGVDANGNVISAPSRDKFTTTTPGGGYYIPRQLTGSVQDSIGDPRGTYVPGAPTTSFDQAGYDQALQAYNASQQQQTGSNPLAGYFTHQFNAGDLNSNLAPNYQFQLDQGLGATRNASNLQTGLLSGNTLKGINDYAQNFAGNAYQQAFNNYTTNQSNIFNRLSNIAGLGQTANQQSSSLAGQIAPGVSSSIQGVGAAQAAGQVGQANALTGAANNALGWYTLSQLNGGGNV